MQLEEVWLSSSESSDTEVVTAPDNSDLSSSNRNLLWNLLFFILLWQSIYRVSNAAVGTILKIFKAFLQLFIKGIVSTPEQSQMFNLYIPTNVKAAQRILWSTSKDDFICYVVCPKCDSLYDYSENIVQM